MPTDQTITTSLAPTTRCSNHLALADRHIAECNAHIARQREVIEGLRKDGHATDTAEATLHAVESRLHTLERIRDLILARLNLSASVQHESYWSTWAALAIVVFVPLMIVVGALAGHW